MKRLLVTGFGPFPGVMRNPSAEIARRVAASARWHVEHPSPAEWTEQDTRGEEAALSTAGTSPG